MSIDSAISIAWDVLKYVVAPIKRGFGYVMSSESYANNLREEVEKLEYEAERLHNAMEEASNNLRNVYSRTTELQASSEKASKEARDLLGDFEKATKTCCYGTLPDPNCRYQFSRKAKHKIEDIQRLAGNCRELHSISYTRPPPGNGAASTLARKEGKDAIPSTTETASPLSASTSIKLRDDGIFESRASVIQKIMDALANNNNSVVGVHGMGGVGKSTLLDVVEKRIREKNSFDWVAKADVSQNPDIKKIQDEIAHCLGLSLIKKEENVSLRAKLLRERLEDEERKKKKVLIILDNLWKGLDLKSVGIPCGHDNKVIGCKLLLTSRYLNILQTEMGCDRDFRLAELKEEEARGLFEGMVGEKVHNNEFRPLVDEALGKCAGLPLLIVTMAKHFKYATPPEWRVALNQIGRSTNKGISATINDMLQLSYDHLESDEAKRLLQLCVAYGVPDPSVENLVRYGYGLGIFPKDSSMKEARDGVSTLVRTLQASSLLLDNGGEDGFKIHDLIRDFVAQFVLRDSPLLLLKDENMLATQLQKERLKSCTAICFPFIDMKELPEELDCPDCPELRIFLLFNNNESLEVPDSTFNSMGKLAVLNLTSIRLTRSPTPFQLLKNLHTLSLHNCSLEDVAILGELKGLQILSFVNSKIQRLPKEIGQLVELRLLDLNSCPKLQIIEPGALESLIKLEELYMENSFHQWNAVEQTPRTNASMIELNHMKNLCTLHVSIPDQSVLPGDLNIEKLTEFKIQIGHIYDFSHWRWFSKYEGSRTLKLKLNPTSNILQKGCIRTTLDRTDDLWLAGLNGIEQSICQLSLESFPQLKRLHVRESPSIRYILKRSSLPTFETLEFLFLENLINLEKLCHNDISSKSFSALKVLRVDSCDKMEHLFPLSLVREFPQLKEIEVVDCKLMRGIVKDDDCGQVELRNLHVLKLRDLPSIKNFVAVGLAPSSSTSDDQVGTQVAFFNRQQVSIPSLESLTMEGLPNLKEIWSDDSPLELSNLRSLLVMNCESLSKVMSTKSLVNLPKLHTFSISNCNLVQEIFDLDGPRANGNVNTLSEVTTFSLRKLESLIRIWNKNPYHNLKKLEAYDCPNLRFMFFPSMVISLAQLSDLTVENCKKMEAIIMEEEGLGLETSKTLTFPMLAKLNLQRLESLMCFSRGKCSREARSQDRVKSHSVVLFSREVSIPSLESLTIDGLPNLKEIWSNDSPLELSNLRSLLVMNCESLSKVMSTKSLVNLPKLHTFSISNCNSVQEIFDLDGPRANVNVNTLSEVTTFSLRGLGSLRRIWNKNPYHNLKKLEAYDCPNLRFMFFPSMVISLAQLSDLTVESCKKMEAIIMEEEGLGLETSKTLAFPMLAKLNLQRLESLMCFSRGKCSRESPSQGRVKSHSAALFSREQVIFPGLETLQITGLDNIVMIWDDQVAVDSFPKLKSLCVGRCNGLVNIVTSSILGRIFSLESLEARSCGSLKVVFKFQPLNPLDGHPIVRSPLKELALFDLPELKCVWDKELHRQVKFQYLRSVSVDECESLTSLFPASIARDLAQFEELNIKICGIVGLIEKEGPEELSINVEAIDGASHELKVILPFTSYFQHLKTLDVSYCDGLSNMFTPAMATNLVALTILRMSNCRILTKVLGDEEGEEGRVVAFNQLKYMVLDGLIELRCFSSGGYTLMFPLLEDIIVNGCPNMKFFSKGPIEAPKLERVKVVSKVVYGPQKYEYFWKGNLNITIQNMFEETATVASAKFMRLFEFPELIGKWHSELNPVKSSWQLETLVVDKCPSFINAIPSKSMLILEKMTSLQVRDCKSMEEIFDFEGLEAMESTRVLPRLQHLDLVNLPKLRQLWNKYLQGKMCFDSLSGLTLYKCSNLRHAFTTSMVRCLANLCWMKIKECDQIEGVIIEEEGQGSAVEKITFPKLQVMKLECLPNLTNFLSGKDHTLDCPEMEYLIIAHCPKIKSLTWQSLMDINHGTPSLFTPQVQFPQLKSMELSYMDKISKIWSDNAHETLTFDYLGEVEVQNCKSLENLFPHWVAASLKQLKKLQVECCEIKEIVASGYDTPHSNTAQVLFSRLTSLVLHDIPRLKSLCLNLPTLNWLVLEEFRVTHCDKMNMLSFAASMNKWTQRDDQRDLSNQEAHSSIERDFPMLERLSLVDKNIQMIQDGKLSTRILGKPKALTLACFHEEMAIFPTGFLLERFQNLQSLEIFCSSFEDIFLDEGLVDEGKHLVLESLRELKLSKLHNLKRVWREDSLVSKILWGIKTFEVWDCPCLTTLFPAVKSFQNLTELVVKNSSGLVHLVTVSALTNLLHLAWMTIIGCERMKEVVANDGYEERKVISLGKLKGLTLQHLPSLECFSSIPSCIFNFPSLFRIEVEECPKMLVFSKGTLRTPGLEYVMLFGYNWEGKWKGGDLNTTIQKIST